MSYGRFEAVINYSVNNKYDSSSSSSDGGGSSISQDDVIHLMRASYAQLISGPARER